MAGLRVLVGLSQELLALCTTSLWVLEEAPVDTRGGVQ